MLKRARLTRSTVVVRGSRPEMKRDQSNISHAAATASDLLITDIGQSTTSSSRVGRSCRIWHIKGLVRCDEPVRVDIYSPYDGSALSHTISQSVDLNSAYIIRQYYFNPPQTGDVNGWWVDIKLPGTHCNFSGALGSDCNKNAIFARIQTANAATVTGYFVTYFTDP